jgi:hypothetical protein
MYSLRNMNVSNLYTTMKSLSNGGGQAASNHNLSSLESSMLTNMQWGAAAYLTESVYGTCTGTKGSAVCTAQPQINSVGSTSPLIKPVVDHNLLVQHHLVQHVIITIQL